MKIKISIIMPVYNSQKYLSYAIDSIRNQSMREFELILVDDGSTDDSGKICDYYANEDNRIITIHKNNGGICDARNVGLAAAKGEYVGFMDNDDFINPDTFKHNYELLVKNNADWIKFGKTEILILDNKVIKKQSSNLKKAVYEENEIISQLIKLRSEGAMTFVWDSLINRKIIIDSGIKFDLNFKSGNEDIDFCEQIAACCNKLIINPFCYYVHYTRLGISASSIYSMDKILSYLYLLHKSNERYKKYCIDGKQTDEDYAYIITKQIIINICQKLNDAGCTLTRKEKKMILKTIKDNPEMARYNSICITRLYKRSKKIFFYRTLFLKNHFSLLLLIENLTHKLVYKYRSIIVNKEMKQV